MKHTLSKKQRRNLIRIVIALAAFAAIFIADKTVGLATVFDGSAAWLFPFFLYLAVYLVIGYDVLWRAVRNVFRGQVFDENFLMCVATLGAFALAIYRGATGQQAEGFDEACAVLLFYQVGEWFQSYATGRSRSSVAALMDIRPDYANVMRNGETVRVSPDEVAVGETILINPGEKVPLDGIAVFGQSTLDVKALTGESLPKEVSAGDEVISGSVNVTSQLHVKVTKAFYDSTVSKILELVENASEQKSKAENFITRFARYYTPAVCGVALALAVVPPLVDGAWSQWVYRALSFLVVSCPCALVISVPLSFFAGIGAASRKGILVKGSNYLEKLNKANIFVFDKTGTLTKGNFAVTKVHSVNGEDVLRLAAIAEQNSNHPIARSVAASFNGEIDKDYVLTNVAGRGVIAQKGEDVILCGNAELLEQNGVHVADEQCCGTMVYVAHNGQYCGFAAVSDEVKSEAADALRQLGEMGCSTVMLTGDSPDVAKTVAEQVGVTRYKASLLPQNKVQEVEKLLAQKGKGDVLCFVGDGINDAPVLMRSDVGVAMGAVGSDAAIEASDVVLMRDDLSGLPLAKRLAKRTMAIVFQNIVFSLVVKVAILVLAALGIANMWFAVFGDVGVAVLAILNSMRNLR